MHTFTADGTFSTEGTLWADVLLVGGGGSGGGRHAGGGGGGGVVYLPGIKIDAGDHAVVVGAGGAQVYHEVKGNNGGDTPVDFSPNTE